MEVPVTDFALILFLVLIPPLLRWVTAADMGRYRSEMLRSDEDYKKLVGKLSDIKEAQREVDRQQRQYASRRVRLYGQIEAARTELASLRRPLSSRVAA